MRFFHCVTDRQKFFFFRLIYDVLQIFTLHRDICGNLNNIHAVYIAKFLFLCQSRTCHTAFLFKFIKKVLERDSRKRLAFTFYFYMLFGFYCLMEPVGITASRHNTPGKFIYNQNLIVLYHIILIPEHQVMRAQRQNDIVLDFQVFRVGQVFNPKKLFYFFYAVLCQVDNLVLFIDYKIAAFLYFDAHNGVHLRKFLAFFAFDQLLRQNIAGFIQLGRLAALAGNNKRRPCLVDQYGVYLVDNGIVQAALYKLFFVNHHIVPKVIKSQFIIGNISNIAVICFPPLVIVHRI